MVAAAHRRDVRRDRLGHLGHRQPELGEPLLGGAHASGPLEVGDQVLRVHPGHHLDQLPAVLAEVVEDLLGRVHQHGRGHVLPLGHDGTLGRGVSILDASAPLPDAVLRYDDRPGAVVDVYLPAGPVHTLVRVPARRLLARGLRPHPRPAAGAARWPRDGYGVALPEYRRVGGGGGWPTTCDDVAAAVAALPDLLAGIGVAPDAHRARPDTRPAATSRSGWPAPAPPPTPWCATRAGRRPARGPGDRHGRRRGRATSSAPTQPVDAADPAVLLGRAPPGVPGHASCTAPPTTRSPSTTAAASSRSTRGSSWSSCRASTTTR